MSAWLIGVCAALYLGTAAHQFLKGNSGLGITFLAYAVANVGLIMAERRA